MHNSPLIGAGSGAADSPFLSRSAPFSLCLPAAPADAAADEETRRGRQRSRPALPSPGRHRHGSFRSRLSGSPAISGERPAGCLSCAGGLRCPGSRGWGAGGGLGPLVQSRGVLQLPAALSPPGMTPRTPKNSLAQEKWGHGHTKPCSPMLGWPASGPGAGRVTVQGVPVPLWHSGGGHGVPCGRQEHTRRGHLRMSPAGGSKGGGGCPAAHTSQCLDHAAAAMETACGASSCRSGQGDKATAVPSIPNIQPGAPRNRHCPSQASPV